MTTRVTVYPTGHPVVVEITDGTPGVGMTERLEPWAPVQDFHVYGNLVLTIREVTTE